MCDNAQGPVSAEAYARHHQGMIDAIRVAVREELGASQANGARSFHMVTSLLVFGGAIIASAVAAAVASLGAKR